MIITSDMEKPALLLPRLTVPADLGSLQQVLSWADCLANSTGD